MPKWLQVAIICIVGVLIVFNTEEYARRSPNGERKQLTALLTVDNNAPPTDYYLHGQPAGLIEKSPEYIDKMMGDTTFTDSLREVDGLLKYINDLQID